MKLEEKRNAQRSAKRVAPPKTVGLAVKDWTSSEVVAKVLNRLRDDLPRFVACAPGLLDVIGGIAEYTGSLVLAMATGEQVCASVQPRTDDTITIENASENAREGHARRVLPLSQLYGANGVPVTPQEGLERTGDWDDTARGVLSALVEALREGVVPDFAGGLTVAVATTAPGVGVMRSAALAGATLGATARAFGVEVDLQHAFEICRRIENDWLGWPVGSTDAVCALLGEPHTLMQLQSESRSVVGKIPLPDDLALVGIDCGNCKPDAIPAKST